MDLRKGASSGQHGAMTGGLALAGRRRWLIEIARGESHLVGSDEELRELVRRRPVTSETRVYEVGAGPRPLRSVPELARLLPEVEESEPPPIRPHLHVEARSPERIKLSEELAVLNRPLEGEIEYYDEAPRSRAKAVLAVVAILAALGSAGYVLRAQRHHAADDAAADSMRQGEQASPSGAHASASARTAAAPAKAPASELEPEGDPPPSATAASK